MGTAKQEEDDYDDIKPAHGSAEETLQIRQEEL